MIDFDDPVERAEWLEANMQRIPARYRGADPDETDVGGGLFLFGPVGTGKTHKAAGVMRAHIERFDRARWITVPVWLHEQRESIKTGAEVKPLAYWTGGRLLVLDDIGVERATDWAVESLYVLVADAYNRETPLVVTSNLTFELLADRLGPRIVDRLVEICSPIELSGRSRRMPAGRR